MKQFDVCYSVCFTRQLRAPDFSLSSCDFHKILRPASAWLAFDNYARLESRLPQLLVERTEHASN
jgi:hypothetical protein